MLGAISRAANSSPDQREEPAINIPGRKHPPRVAVREGPFAIGAVSGIAPTASNDLGSPRDQPTASGERQSSGMTLL